jgi:O-antigen/teichoic acid export membrane protein
MASGVSDLRATAISRVVILAAGLASQSALAWLLGPGGLGSYTVCLLFSSLLSLVFLFGMEFAGRYFVASRRFTLSEGISHILVCGLIGCAAAIGVGLLLMQMPLAFLLKASPQAFYLALGLIPTSLFSGSCVRLFSALGEFRWQAILTSVLTPMQPLFYVLMIWVLRLGVEGALLAILLNNVLTLAAALAFFRWKHDLTWARPTLKGVYDMFHYGIRYYGGQVSNQVNFQAGTIILAFFASKEAVGMFSLAEKVVGYILMVPDSLGEVLIPRVAVDDRGRASLVAQSSRLSAVVCAGLLALLALCAKPFVHVFFSSAFLPMVPLIWVLAIGFAIRAATKVIEYFMLATNRPGVSSLAVGVGVVTNLALLWLLMPLLSVLGAAIAMSGSFLLSGLILTVAFGHYTGMRQWEIWRPRRADYLMLVEVFRRVRARLIPGSQGEN